MPTISHDILKDVRWAYDGAGTGHAGWVYGGYWRDSILWVSRASGAVCGIERMG